MRRDSTLGSIRSLFAYGIGPILGLITAPVLARTLGPEGRGELASILQPAAVATGLACMGVPIAVTHYIALGYSAKSSLHRGLLTAVPASLVTYLGMMFLAGNIAESSSVSTWVYLLAWLIIPANVTVLVYRGYWQGMSAWKRLDSERLLIAAATFVSVITLATFDVSQAQWYALLQVTLALCMSLAVLVRSRDRGDRGSPPLSQLVGYSLGAWPSLIFLYMGNRLDQALMPAAGGVQELGYYAVAVTAAEVPLIFSALIGREALTAASQGSIPRMMLSQSLPYWITVVAAAASLALMAPWAVPLIFGFGFERSTVSVQILCLGTIAGSVVVFCISALSGYGYPRLSALPPAATLAATLLGFMLYWNNVTSAVAAWISTISQVAGAVLGVWLLIETRRLSRSELSDPRSSRTAYPDS